MKNNSRNKNFGNEIIKNAFMQPKYKFCGLEVGGGGVIRGVRWLVGGDP